MFIKKRKGRKKLDYFDLMRWSVRVCVCVFVIEKHQKYYTAIIINYFKLSQTCEFLYQPVCYDSTCHKKKERKKEKKKRRLLL
jgi:hypothetical protein